MIGHRRTPRCGRVVLGIVLLVFPVAAGAQQEELPEVVQTLLEAADRERDAGRPERAIAGYRDVIRRAPGALDAYRSLGALLHARGDRPAALAVFRDGLDRAPADPALAYNAAVVAFELERFDEALSYVERALAARPRDAETHALKAAVLRRLGRPQQALQALGTAVDLAPDDAQMRFRLGNQLYELGERQRAVDAFRAALERDPGLLRAAYNLGAVLFEEGELEAALAAYRLALEPIDRALERGQKVEPMYAQAYLNLGAIHVQRRDWAAAEEAYGKALRLDPEATQALYNLGYVHYQRGDEAAAEAAYRRALKRDPTLPLACLHLGQITFRRGELAEAARWLEQGLPKLAGDDRRRALRLLAEIRHRRGEIGAAIAAYRSLLQLEPVATADRVALGRLLIEDRQLAAAEAVLEGARRQAPADAGVILGLARLAEERRQPARAQELYEQLERDGGPLPWQLELRLVRTLLQRGELDGASRRLAGGLPAELQGGPAAAWQRVRALLLARAGRPELARQAAGGPGDGLVRALIEALDGELERAADLLSRSLEGGRLDPLARAWALADRGLVLWLAGRGPAARVDLEAAIKALPDEPLPRLALGEIALAAADYGQAVAQLAAARARCRRPAGSGAVAGDLLLLVLEPLSPAADELCARATHSLAAAHLGAAFELLPAAMTGAAARARAKAHLDAAVPFAPGSSLDASRRFARGTLALFERSWAAARQELEAALAADLPAGLEAPAHNNLAVALIELGSLQRARRQLETARRRGERSAELNLGILLDDHLPGGSEQARQRYRAYLEAGGERSDEVRRWLATLEAVYGREAP